MRPAHAPLFRLLSSLAPLPPEAVVAVERLLGSRSFPRDAWLLRAGQHAEQSFFIVSGLVREFYTDRDGIEHTRTFLSEGSFTGSLIDLLSEEPAVTSIQALEPTETLAFRYRDFAALFDRFPSLERCARRVAEDLYRRKVQREHEMLALSAEERHDRWLAEHRALDARIRRKDLASYLGVTPEHLSRLRARRAH
jgi:CRP-like cAMP-binding protein